MHYELNVWLLYVDIIAEEWKQDIWFGVVKENVMDWCVCTIHRKYPGNPYT